MKYHAKYARCHRGVGGGQGERLWRATRDRPKPAVPFGALYRIIDITLSNA
jgi:glucose-1-phosphate adenylyltransferase